MKKIIISLMLISLLVLTSCQVQPRVQPIERGEEPIKKGLSFAEQLEAKGSCKIGEKTSVGPEDIYLTISVFNEFFKGEGWSDEKQIVFTNCEMPKLIEHEVYSFFAEQGEYATVYACLDNPDCYSIKEERRIDCEHWSAKDEAGCGYQIISIPTFRRANAKTGEVDLTWWNEEGFIGGFSMDNEGEGILIDEGDFRMRYRTGNNVAYGNPDDDKIEICFSYAQEEVEISMTNELISSKVGFKCFKGRKLLENDEQEYFFHLKRLVANPRPVFMRLLDSEYNVDTLKLERRYDNSPIVEVRLE